MAPERVAVVGTGANGAAISADLIRAGSDVTLIEQWPAHVEAMRAHGITVRVDGRDEVTQVKVLHLCEVATLRTPFDVVLVVVKAYDTRWAVELIRPLVSTGGLVAGVQNGMTTDAIADIVGKDRAVGTVIEVSATMTEPGLVDRHTGPQRSWFAVGDPFGALGGAQRRVAELLAAAGRVAEVEAILPTKWMKLVSNSMLLVPTAICGLPMLDTVDVAGMPELMLAAGREALAVGAAQGYPVLPIFGLTAADVADVATVAQTLHDVMYRDFVVPGATTTVLQDWTKGRRSEATEINGAVVELGERLGVPTPVNAVILDAARRIESGASAPGPDASSALLGDPGMHLDAPREYLRRK